MVNFLAKNVPIPGAGKAQLFVKRTPAVPPKWAALFKDSINLQSLSVPGVSAAFLVTVGGRRYVLTFGQGGRFLIKDNVCEERFGLLCAGSKLVEHVEQGYGAPPSAEVIFVERAPSHPADLKTQEPLCGTPSPPRRP